MNENDTRTPQKKANNKANKSQRKGQRKKAKNIYRTWTQMTDIINMSESVTLWVLRKFNWWINWLNKRMNICLNEWMNAWHECRAGKRIWISKSKSKTKWSKPNQSPIGNLQSHPHPHPYDIIIKAATETKQNPEQSSGEQRPTVLKSNWGQKCKKHKQTRTKLKQTLRKCRDKATKLTFPHTLRLFRVRFCFCFSASPFLYFSVSLLSACEIAKAQRRR